VKARMDNIGHITVEVRIVGERLWMFRVKLALWIIRFASWLMPRNVKVEVNSETRE